MVHVFQQNIKTVRMLWGVHPTRVITSHTVRDGRGLLNNAKSGETT